MADPPVELRTPLREFSTAPAGPIRKAIMFGSALAAVGPQIIGVLAMQYRPELVTAESLLGWCALSAAGIATHLASHKLGRGKSATWAGDPAEITIHDLARLGEQTKGGMRISGDQIHSKTWSDHYDQ